MIIRWSHLGIPLCPLNLHAPVRNKTKWDGKYYVANCRHCDRPIVRKDSGVWKKA